MTQRTTFALDKGTVSRIKSLAKRWKVSQAEAVRRAVAMTETTASKPDPVAMLRDLHAAGGGLSAPAARSYLTEIREDRRHWRGR
jgi:hypothetical protein